MAFVANPLSLSIPEASFDAWLRESGHLETLERAGDSGGRGSSPILGRRIRLSLFGNLFKPFARLTAEDLARPPLRWAGQFWDSGGDLTQSYGWPLSGPQLQLRIEDNLKRYAGNYLRLSLLVFVCFLYKVPLSLLGIIAIFGLWDAIVRLCNLWRLRRENISHQLIFLIGKIVTTIVIIYCKVALAMLWAGILSFLVTITHSSFRKITPLKGSVKKLDKKR